jgi:hypothetical protein
MRLAPTSKALFITPLRLRLPRFSLIAFGRTRAKSLLSVRTRNVGRREVVISIIFSLDIAMRVYFNVQFDGASERLNNLDKL